MDNDDESLAALRADLASSLKDLRQRADISTPRLALELGWSQSKVSKVENNRMRPSADDVRAWAAATKAGSRVTAGLVADAEHIHTVYRSWRTSLAAGLASRQRKIAAVEAASLSVRNFQPHVIPGLLQTPAYAAHVLRLIDESPAGDVEDAVHERMNRQAVLLRSDKRFVFVLGEGALLWRVGSPSDRRAQAEQLLTAQALPSVRLAVLPFARQWPLLPATAFTLFDVPDEPTVLIEDDRGENLLTGEQDVSRYVQRLESAVGAAVSGDVASDLIRRRLR